MSEWVITAQGPCLGRGSMLQQGGLVTVARLHEQGAVADLKKPSGAILGGSACRRAGSGS